MNVSGLVIEIAPGDYNDDEAKFNEFVQSPNWDVYVELCSNYGFMIDQNAPWRLVADLKSESMRAYSERRGIGSMQALFKTWYRGTYLDYFRNFQRRLLRFYNKVKPPYISQTYTCKDGSIKNKILEPAHYSIADLNRLYSEEYFLEFYFNIRLLEEESTKTANEKRMFKEDCMKVYRAYDAATALLIFERIVNLPIDYVGSYNYNRMKKKLIADAQAHAKGASVAPSTYADSALSMDGGGY